MYTLYSHRNSYAMTAQVMLEELGLAYETVVFNVHVESERPAAFLKANPNGRVPTLITPDGPIYESAAILVYLAERHGGDRFVPAVGDPRRRLFWQWQFYLMSTLQPEVLIQFHPERYFPSDETSRDKLLRASTEWLEQIWRVLDDGLADGPHFLGDLYTTCDISFAMQALWRENQPSDLASYPNAARNLRTVLARPAVQTVLKIHTVEHLADGL